MLYLKNKADDACGLEHRKETNWQSNDIVSKTCYNTEVQLTVGLELVMTITHHDLSLPETMAQVFKSLGC